MQNIKTIFELAYFVSGVLLAFAGLYGIQQVRIVKKDLSMRIQRAAKEKAIEYSGRYLTVCVPLLDAYDRERNRIAVPRYSGPIGAFTSRSIPNEHLKQFLDVIREAAAAFLPALNELNHIAAAFAYGVADDETGFVIFGRSYCETVTSLYVEISYVRSDESSAYWEPIVKLYRTWSSRLSRKELESLRGTLDRHLARLGELRIPPIGEEK